MSRYNYCAINSGVTSNYEHPILPQGVNEESN